MSLSGGRRVVRSIVFWAVGGLAAIGGAGYVLPAHRLEHEASFHSNFADGGPFSVLAFALVAGLALALRGRGLGAGIVTGVTAIAGSVLSLGPVLLVHMFFRVDYTYGEYLFAAGIVGTFCSGVLLTVIEPVLYVLERHRLEQAERTPLPVARVVE